MNSNTREALKKACDALKDLAYGCSHVTGHLTIAIAVGSLEELKIQLDKDETILE